MSVMANTLTALEAEVRRQLELLDYPKRPWVPERTDGALDVAIIGAGQTGLATAFGLRREKVGNVAVFDRAEPGATGCWTVFARMRTLRTPKHVSGPDLGVAALTPRAFFEARDGLEAWEDLHKIGRVDWQRYLDWYAQVLALPVRHEHELLSVGHDPEADLLLLRFRTPEGERVVKARKMVLATGMDGTGAWSIPAPFDGLPGERVSHTSGHVDFEALKGKRILVVGAGASAFDNLATALEDHRVRQAGVRAHPGTGGPRLPRRHARAAGAGGGVTARGHADRGGRGGRCAGGGTGRDLARACRSCASPEAGLGGQAAAGRPGGLALERAGAPRGDPLRRALRSAGGDEFPPRLAVSGRPSELCRRSWPGSQP